MTKIDEKTLATFADKLRLVADMLDRCSVEMRGQKSLQQKTRVKLTEIKKSITDIKKITIK